MKFCNFKKNLDYFKVIKHGLLLICYSELKLPSLTLFFILLPPKLFFSYCIVASEKIARTVLYSIYILFNLILYLCQLM